LGGHVSKKVPTLHAARMLQAASSHAQEVYDRICRANSGKASGCFDVFAWKDGDYFFVESKRKSKDSIQKTQKAWIVAALAV
jgi:hypothetical protein